MLRLSHVYFLGSFTGSNGYGGRFCSRLAAAAQFIDWASRVQEQGKKRHYWLLALDGVLGIRACGERLHVQWNSNNKLLGVD